MPVTARAPKWCNKCSQTGLMIAHGNSCGLIDMASQTIVVAVQGTGVLSDNSYFKNMAVEGYSGYPPELRQTFAEELGSSSIVV